MTIGPLADILDPVIASGGVIPSDAVLYDDGTAVFYDDGNYVVYVN